MKNLNLSKQLVEGARIEMSVIASKILYSTIHEKLNQLYSNGYQSSYDNDNKVINWDNVDIDLIMEEEVIINMDILKKIFKKNLSFREMANQIIKIPYVIKLDSKYDDEGNKIKNVLYHAIVMFTDITAYDENKTIGFKFYKGMFDYIVNIKKFARINIDEYLKLKTQYELRMYSLIAENNYYDCDGKKNIKDEARKIKIDDFRKMLSIPEVYKQGHIDQKILNPIQKGFKEKIGYDVTIKKFKLDTNDRKKVTHYRIDVDYKKPYEEKKENNLKIKEVQSKSVFDMITEQIENK